MKSKKKQAIIVDCMPPGAVPKYDCGEDSTPVVCKIQTKKDGTVESKLVKVKKDDTSCRYVVPLYPINGDTLLGIANILRGMKRDKVSMFDVVLCIRNGEIGLAKHDCGVVL